MSAEESHEEALKALQERHQQLREKRSEAEGMLKSAQADLQRLQVEADRQFGTSNIKELKAMLKDMQKKNQRMIKQYNEKYAELEAAIDAIEAEYEAEQAEEDDEHD